MNFFYDLPDDILEKIYRFEHSLKFNEQISQQINNSRCRNYEFDNFIWIIFFNSDMNNKEVKDFNFFIFWFDNVIEEDLHHFGDSDIQKIGNNKYVMYYVFYYHFHFHLHFQYFPGDYI